MTRFRPCPPPTTRSQFYNMYSYMLYEYNSVVISRTNAHEHPAATVHVEHRRTFWLQLFVRIVNTNWYSIKFEVLHLNAQLTPYISMLEHMIINV